MRVFLFLLIGFSILWGYRNKIEPDLWNELKNISEEEYVDVILYLGSYDYDFAYTLPTWEQRKAYLKQIASETQRDIVDFLKQRGFWDIKQLWIANKIRVKITKKGLFEVLDRFPEKIKYVWWDIKGKVEPLPMNTRILSDFYPGKDHISGSIMNVKADEAWRRGYKGKGIVIGIIDTGVDLDHPVLKNSYRGVLGWYDPNGGTTEPVDTNGHGTGALSLAIGAIGIGVAPGAKWIASNALEGSISNISDAMQWMANLDSLRPHLVTNSWGLTSSTSTELWDEIQTWLLAGIIPVFAIGNSGPSGSSTSPPGNYPMVFGIGGTWWPTEEIMYYSSRGPAPNQSPWTNTAWWPRPDWSRHKPDLIAPSEPTIAALSTDIGSDKWWEFSGTSAACPHAAGVVALLLQANNFGIIPGMGTADTSEIKDVYQLMTNNSYWDPAWGAPSTVRDTYGWGRVDIEKYISNIPDPSYPHVFIDSIWVDSTYRSGQPVDKDIEPAERVWIGMRIVNTGANANNLYAEIVYSSSTAIFITGGGPISIGSLPHNDTFEMRKLFYFNTSAGLPESTRIYFTLKITATGYTNYDFFYIDTYKRLIPKERIWVYYHDGGGENAYDDIYFAQRFSSPNEDTIVSVRIQMYQGGGSVCSLFVWEDNNNLPGNLVYSRQFTLNNVYPDWQTINIPAGSRPVMAGNYWVGFWTAGSGAPYSVMDGTNNPSSITVRGNDRTNWTVYDGQEYMLEVLAGRPGIEYPVVEIASYEIDDSKFGNDNGRLEPSEKFELSIAVNNQGLNVWEVTGTLELVDENDTQYIKILKNNSNFGLIPYGKNTRDNTGDSWVLQYKEVAMYGYSWNFRVIFQGTYNNNQSWVDTVNFSISAALSQPDSSLWWLESGTDPLVLYYNPCSYGMFYESLSDVFFGLSMEDSFFVREFDLLYYSKDLVCNNVNDAGEFQARIRADDGNFNPGILLWSQDSPNEVTDPSWVRFNPPAAEEKLPGWSWIGWYNTASGFEVPGNEYNVVVTKEYGFGSELAEDDLYTSSLTLIDTDGNGTFDSYIGAPIPMWLRIEHYHASVSYFKPDGWDLPLVPSNTEGDTVLPSILKGYDWRYSYVDTINADTTWVSLAIFNRSSMDISAPPTPTATGARDVWDNYIFLDNFAFWNISVNFALPKWNYAVATSGLHIPVPGGRHTLFLGLDWNNEVGGNIFNEPLRYWGMQFVWDAPPLHPTKRPVRVKWVPELTGPMAGPYYNVTVYSCSLRPSILIPGYGKPWFAVGIRNFNVSISGDSIDLDLRLYKDAPSDPYTGFTEVVEASELGFGEVDFVVMDGHHLNTTFYAGVYSFVTPSSGPDSAWIQFESARKVLNVEMPPASPIQDTFRDSTVLHVYDVIIENGEEFRCTLDVLTGTQDFAMTLYDSEPEDRIKKRIDYIAKSDASGPGGQEIIIFTNTGPTDTFGLVIWGKRNTYSEYTLKGNFTYQALSVYETVELNAEDRKDGIVLSWTKPENALKIVVNKKKKGEKSYKKLVELKGNSSEYLDKEVIVGETYLYELEIHYKDKINIVGPVEVLYLPVNSLTLLNFPSVIKDKGILKIAVPEKQKVEIVLYDSAGRVSKIIHSGFLEKGVYRFEIRKRENGVYFLRIKGPEKRIKKKILVL